ncbi:MAG: YbhB/YbcL family Raf kinase inhibitor-like protein [Candidatus Micrarchaeota archaeon]
MRGFLLLFLLLAGCVQEQREILEVSAMRLESPAFENGGTMPEKYSCDGEDVSPELRLNGVPNGTNSLALVMDDPDAPTGTFVHWVAWNIPSGIRTVPEDSSPGVDGTNDFGRTGYGGPCPPPGPAHNYRFRIYALDATLNLSTGSTRAQLDSAMQGHILAQAELRGKYGR